MRRERADKGRKPKRVVEYTPNGTWKEHCSDCVHFTRPTMCELVQGPVAPYGWCKLFKRKPEAPR